MKSVSGKEFARILERHGRTLFRVRGTHHIYGKPESVVRISVPVHGSTSRKIGLVLKRAIRDSRSVAGVWNEPRLRNRSKAMKGPQG